MNPTGYRDIIPDDLQNLLIGYRHTTTEICFQIGDICNMIYSSMENNNVDITRDFIQSAVGYFCGKSGRTVRFYACVAEFFDSETRSKYDPLSFSHFSYAKSLPNWQEVLDYALDNNVSVDGMIVQFSPIQRIFAGIPQQRCMYDLAKEGGDMGTEVYRVGSNLGPIISELRNLSFPGIYKDRMEKIIQDLSTINTEMSFSN